MKKTIVLLLLTFGPALTVSGQSIQRMLKEVKIKECSISRETTRIVYENHSNSGRAISTSYRIERGFLIWEYRRAREKYRLRDSVAYDVKDFDELVTNLSNIQFSIGNNVMKRMEVGGSGYSYSFSTKIGQYLFIDSNDQIHGDKSAILLIQQFIKNHPTKEQQKQQDLLTRKVEELEKDGWIVLPGALSLEKQVDRAFEFENARDANNSPVYVIGDGHATAENIAAAKVEATELARMDLAVRIRTEVEATIDSLVTNKTLSQDQAAVIYSALLVESGHRRNNKLSRFPVICSFHRTLQDGRKEAWIRMAVKMSQIKQTAMEYVKDEMRSMGIEIN